MSTYKIQCGDCLEVMAGMADKMFSCCITSPPYWGLRDYGVDGQFGLEKTPEEYVRKMVAVFAEVRRVLKDEGTLWLNLGDSYSGGFTGRNDTTEKYESNVLRRGVTPGIENQSRQRSKPVGLKEKDLVGIPWRVAFALQADGWYLRQDIIWSKPNPMPESVTDRCTKAHEYIFLLSKKARYYFDAKAIAEPASTTPHAPGWSTSIPDRNDRQVGNESNGREWAKSGMANKRSVWTIPTQAFPEAHFATFPEALVSPCVLAGCPAGGTVLDPFNGAGTTGIVALKHGRSYVGIELNPEYCAMAEKRIRDECGLLIGSG